MKMRTGLAAAALLAMAIGVTGLETLPITRRRDDDDPDNRGRRAEKDAIALAKAEARRKRRNAKRLKDMGPNVEVTGAEPALSAERPR